MQPTYYVMHPDGNYTLAEPQPVLEYPCPPDEVVSAQPEQLTRRIKWLRELSDTFQVKSLVRHELWNTANEIVALTAENEQTVKYWGETAGEWARKYADTAAERDQLKKAMPLYDQWVAVGTDLAAAHAARDRAVEALREAQCPNAYKQTLHADKRKRGECDWCNAQIAILAASLQPARE